MTRSESQRKSTPVRSMTLRQRLERWVARTDDTAMRHDDICREANQEKDQVRYDYYAAKSKSEHYAALCIGDVLKHNTSAGKLRAQIRIAARDLYAMNDYYYSNLGSEVEAIIGTERVTA